MKKEDLVKLGLDEEIAKKCEAASNEELKDFIPYDRFKEAIDEKNMLKTTLKERDVQLETLKNTTGDVEGMKKQIETLQGENKTKDETHATEIKQLKIESAVTAALTGARAKNMMAARALLGLDPTKVEFNEDGSIKGLNETLTKLKTADDSKFLFDTETKKTKMKGAEAGEGSDFDPTTVSKEQFQKMNYKEKVELFNTDKELFDSLSK